MVQHLQAKPHVTSFGASESFSGAHAASNTQLPAQSGIFAGRAKKLHGMPQKMLEDELNEHRYYLERKVEQRTEELSKRIKLLESCNTALCDKLAQAKKEISSLRNQQISTQSVAAPKD